MRSRRLLEIREFLEEIDEMASTNSTNQEKILLYQTYANWQWCRNFWLVNKPLTDEAEIEELELKTREPTGQTKLPESKVGPLTAVKPDPKKPAKTWGERISSSDIKFLRSLRITPGNDPIYPDDDEKKGNNDPDPDPA